MAARKYEAGMSLFTTYATCWIRGQLRRARQGARVVWVPIYVMDNGSAWEAAEADGAALYPVDFDDAYDDEMASNEAFLDDAPTPEEAMILAEEAQTVTAALAKLVKRERRILRDHVMDETKTLREIGADLGVTGEYVRQIQDKALKRLQVRLKHAA